MFRTPRSELHFTACCVAARFARTDAAAATAGPRQRAPSAFPGRDTPALPHQSARIRSPAVTLGHTRTSHRLYSHLGSEAQKWFQTVCKQLHVDTLSTATCRIYILQYQFLRRNEPVSSPGGEQILPSSEEAYPQGNYFPSNFQLYFHHHARRDAECGCLVHLEMILASISGLSMNCTRTDRTKANSDTH